MYTVIDVKMKMFKDVTLCLQKEEEKDLVEVCRRLMANLNDGNCTLVWQQQNGKIHFDCVEINGKGTALKKQNLKNSDSAHMLIPANFSQN